ncbi:MgtC/SapB family protein [Bacillus lacus]|uniref:MgtC/SapB family protein n=1 Tax=Metabacillus lacus TaxID=1983721 RepID=A0A7X2LZ74_9BACI|nr:MgtC/SapB family protein [Metabacillus lacus]MRX72578.1 MgtC/SapB family protein [Metabacillus lacus]
MEFFKEFFDPDQLVIYYRVLFAAMLCGFIGLEREFKNHPAGFKTHLLVGVGSCLMMLLSLYGFRDYLDEYSNIQFDPARIPSYVISGIGFLGAGTILVRGATIRGLTTAASIWVVAGLGLIIGAGMYSLAVFATLLVLISLTFLGKMERLIYRNKKRRVIKVEVDAASQGLEKVIHTLHQYRASIHKMELSSMKKKDHGVVTQYNIEVELPLEKLDGALAALMKCHEIKKID